MAVSKPIPIARIDSRILRVRGVKVMLDADLAELYEVQTRVLNQAVKRNHERFPADFMFPLTNQEVSDWRSQIVIDILAIYPLVFANTCIVNNSHEALAPLMEFFNDFSAKFGAR